MCLEPALANKIHYHSIVIEQNDPRVLDGIPQDVCDPDDIPVYKDPVSILLARDFGHKIAKRHEACNVDPFMCVSGNGCCTIVQNHSRCRDCACLQCQLSKCENLIAEWKLKAAVSLYPWFSAVEVPGALNFTSDRRALRRILQPYFVECKADWRSGGSSLRAFICGGLTKETMRALLSRFPSAKIRILPRDQVEPLLRDVFTPTLPTDREELMRWRRACAGRKLLTFWRPSRGDLLRIESSPENLIRNRPQRIWKRSDATKVCRHGKPILYSTPRQRLSTMLEMPQLFFIKTNAPQQWRN